MKEDTIFDVGARLLCVACFCQNVELYRFGEAALNTVATTVHEFRRSLNIHEDASSVRSVLSALIKLQESLEWGLASQTLGKAYCEYSMP
jgi:hypothetical protein